MTPLEKAARALFDASPFRDTEGPYEAQSDSYQELCMTYARAVLMAVRDLDDEADAVALMAGRAVLPEFDEPLQEDAKACFTAMISAILAEPQP